MLPWVKHFLLIFLLLSGSPALAASVNVITEDGKTVSIEVEIAATVPARAEGLMGREDLPPAYGMLFVFPDEAMRYFWMKNTPLSLDILFFDKKGDWAGAQLATTPFSEAILPSASPAQYVLEVKAGEAKKLGIGAGSTLELELLP